MQELYYLVSKMSVTWKTGFEFSGYTEISLCTRQRLIKYSAAFTFWVPRAVKCKIARV